MDVFTPPTAASDGGRKAINLEHKEAYCAGLNKVVVCEEIILSV